MFNIYAAYKGNHLGKGIPAPVTELDVQKELDGMLKEHVHMEPKEGESQNGDIVNIDFEGFLDGVPFEGGKGEKYDLELGSHTFIPGFEEQLVGKKGGDEAEVKVTFPANYQAKNLAGKAVVFKCKVHEVKTKVQHELNDEFASHFGFTSLIELKAAIKSNIEKARQGDLNNEYLQKLLQDFVDKSTIEVDPEAKKEAKERIKEYYTNSIAQYGMTLEDYVKGMGMDQASFERGLDEEATRTAKMDSLTDYIAKKENLEPTEEEINKQIELIKNYYHLPEDKAEEIINSGKSQIAMDVKREKVAMFLLENND